MSAFDLINQLVIEVDKSVMPSDAVTTVAVVHAMPFVEKIALYGPASPVNRSISSARILVASSAPDTSELRNWKDSSAWAEAKCTNS